MYCHSIKSQGNYTHLGCYPIELKLRIYHWNELNSIKMSRVPLQWAEFHYNELSSIIMSWVPLQWAEFHYNELNATTMSCACVMCFQNELATFKTNQVLPKMNWVLFKMSWILLRWIMCFSQWAVHKHCGTWKWAGRKQSKLQADAINYLVWFCSHTSVHMQASLYGLSSTKINISI